MIQGDWGGGLEEGVAPDIDQLGGVCPPAQILQLLL